MQKHTKVSATSWTYMAEVIRSCHVQFSMQWHAKAYQDVCNLLAPINDGLQVLHADLPQNACRQRPALHQSLQRRKDRTEYAFGS